MIGLLFAVLVSGAQAAEIPSKTASPAGNAARVAGDPVIPIPTPGPCLLPNSPMASAGGTPTTTASGTMAMSSGDCPGTSGGVVTGSAGQPPNPPSNWGPRRVVTTPAAPLATNQADLERHTDRVEERTSTSNEPRRVVSRRHLNWLGATAAAAIAGRTTSRSNTNSPTVGPDGR